MKAKALNIAAKAASLSIVTDPRTLTAAPLAKPRLTSLLVRKTAIVVSTAA